MNLDDLRNEYRDNPNKFPAVCCADMLTLIRALELAAEERYKYLRLLGSVSDRKKAIHIHGIISSWLSQAAADLDHPGDA